MRSQTTTSGTELLLSVIAIRLAVLVVVGWGLTLLQPQARNRELGCIPSDAKLPAQTIGPRLVDAAFDDMLRHD
jgi:hypothetical protein